METKRVLIIGGGLAGVEAAYFLAERKIQVVLVEKKEVSLNPAQKMPFLAELVCTNSLKSTRPDSSHGILKGEMAQMGSLVLRIAEKNKVPAGDALAVDREGFSKEITEIIKNHPFIEYLKEDVMNPFEAMKKNNCEKIIIATGPLTSDSLATWIKSHLTKSSEDLYFYDAIAPVVDAESLNFDKLYYKDRYKDIGEELPDYLNAPMDKTEYENFISALLEAEKVPAKDFESYQFFESCLPIDLMAERGRETPRFSCMKPVGLEQINGKRPYACVQLRRENLLGEAFNLVGFQTRLKYPDQKKVFRLIPGLENAEFLHLGSVHRNTFLNSQKLLTKNMQSREFSCLFFAGQITGVEGYTESAASGLYTASRVFLDLFQDRRFEELILPCETAIGALVHYVSHWEKPIPSNINFGLFPTPEMNEIKKKDRKHKKKELIMKNATLVFDKYWSAFSV